MKIRNPKSEIRNNFKFLVFPFDYWKLFIGVCLMFVSWFLVINCAYAADIVIPMGSTPGQIADILVSEKIISNRTFFLFTLKVLGEEDKLKAGTYSLTPGMGNLEVIKKIRKGETVEGSQIRAVIPEGTSVYKIGKILEKEGYLHVEDFLNSAATLEGYLFPDTYILEKGSSPSILINMMFNRFKEKVLPYWNENYRLARFGLHEVLTMASIVEKEAQKPEERPVIASVFYNRLDAKMPLAADPTVKYALENPTKRVLYKQLEVDSPYNTYKRRGLPPGPICNPGLDSIKAAIYPAKTDYFFFVAKKDGSHIFSRTWEEHQRARVRAH
ncbi:hypothetical protein A2276_05375 [candidate division WOR-1 bacterium RIFOXYA12_FULL_43_27]|uniref:Endolytic murein transglycosylase n=1 Tax=candidate division WOR-1 bacterium RIFOXYC2_FULL_46_14 TaxID=1802587 RepID=A0A1F4U3Y2_UNCSA|nr:MAG: hypothetical protein A2276_05375 [candidate division WOR-1 bacterium RIFOXYA12_FULL_43_27]OGC20097.1 MAG: hypothetical protein A2292_03380 [candidate division WOR-1 bacterium RIFOXYB2_FULL_46_45]OGC32167.1 MAG: hypothetical protein A2232_08070 [candidate division WOR-1 bacterium RIFOXYA2_FULL_46_56]OGC39567.1 MAG: hypothetical protein A2438_08435 [candidate division WOR-1 bacterium RIFOXYC2_FULL_46_14]